MSPSCFDKFYADDAALWLCELNPVEWRETFQKIREGHYDFRGSDYIKNFHNQLTFNVSDKDVTLLKKSTSYYEALISTFPNAAREQSLKADSDQILQIDRLKLIEWCDNRGIDVDLFRRVTDNDKAPVNNDELEFYQGVLDGNYPQFDRLNIAMKTAYYLFSDPPETSRSRNKIIEGFIDQSFPKHSHDVNFKKHLSYIATDTPNKK